VELAAGSFHTCARDDHGALRCFGLNADGELGDGTTRSSLEPVAVDLRGVEQVVADRFHTCARLADKTVRCWGQRLPIDYEPAPAQPMVTFRPADAGPPLQPWQLPPVTRPLEVRALHGAVEIGVGSESLCGRMPGGAILCAGSNGLSQLGRSTYFRGRPEAFEPVVGLGPETDGGAGNGLVAIAALAVHEQQACVLLRDTRVRCWGYDVYGSLGVGSEDTVERPAFVVR
jgi:alpha-tubulin suppressor-like RCC1 family protein